MTDLDREAFRRFEHAGWERVAHRYQDAWASLTAGFVAPLLSAVQVRPGDHILDLACGPGVAMATARRMGADAVGVDFSQAMARQAHAREPDLSFVVGDAQCLPLRSAFDRVIMNFGVLHLSHPEAAFAEAYRTLRGSGRFAFTAWLPPERNPGFRIVSDAIEAHAAATPDLPPGPDPFLYADEARCRRALAEAGFAADSVACETVEVRWTVPTVGFLFEAERDAGVRTAGALAYQPPERLEAIRAAIERGVARYATGSGYAIPMAANVVAAAAAP